MTGFELRSLMAAIIASAMVKDMDVSTGDSEDYVVNTAARLTKAIIKRVEWS